MNAAEDQPFTIGIEEEYMLVDAATGALAGDPPPEVIETCRDLIDEDTGNAVPEFLRAQVEVGTTVCPSIKVARERLGRLRSCVAAAAHKYGLAPIAASTHPFAEWHGQKHTDAERYNTLANDMQGVAQRLVISGMHVHVGIADDELRVDLMNQIPYFLPHLLALSTSSPFWRGHNTGLKCYRLSVFDELPRTGLPEKFDSFSEYQRHLSIMVRAGLIQDATKLWWDVRAHARFPTLEMRIPDICTRMDDGITIAALYACIISMLIRLRRSNQRWRVYSNLLVNENRWMAQRYGFERGLVDFGLGRVVPYADLLEEILELTAEDAERLDCQMEAEHAREILARGTSAHRQIATFEAALGAGASEQEAFKAVVDWLREETLVGVPLEAAPGPDGAAAHITEGSAAGA